MNKLAIASLIIGIVLIVISTLYYLGYSLLIRIGGDPRLLDRLFFSHPLTYPLIGTVSEFGPLIAIVGLLLGILALRRKARRRIAIAAIVLNSLSVLFTLVGFVVLSWLLY